jgi:hypothetical protein
LTGSQPQGKTADSTHNTADEQRGTKDSPLFVEQVHAKDADEETTQQRREKAEEASDKTPSNLFNVALVIVGLLQVFGILLQCSVLFRQANLMKSQTDIARQQATIMDRALVATEKAAEAARITAETSYITNLPKLIVSECKVEIIGFDTDCASKFQPSVNITIHNYGGTPAFVVKWEVGIAYNGVSKESLIETPVGVVIQPKDKKLLPTVKPKTYATLVEMDELIKGERWHELTGNVLYDDLFGNRTTFEFCKKLTLRSGVRVISECDTNRPA